MRIPADGKRDAMQGTPERYPFKFRVCSMGLQTGYAFHLLLSFSLGVGLRGRSR